MHPTEKRCVSEVNLKLIDDVNRERTERWNPFASHLSTSVLANYDLTPCDSRIVSPVLTPSVAQNLF
jgi:hypothetical protein